MTSDQVSSADEQPEPDRAESPPLLLSYMRLFRLPNVFTAVADVCMGFFFVNGTESVKHLGVLACLAAASCCFYIAGMVLNDVFDYKVDSVERPHRPLPAGEISVCWARLLGVLLLVAGIVLAAVSGFFNADADPSRLRPGIVGLLLAACILLYDGVLKQTPVGPVFMGGCRFFNVLLGMSVAATWQPPAVPFLTFDVSEFIVAGGIGVYIVGVTWFARHETEESPVALLVAATFVMIAGVGMLAVYPEFGLGSERVIFPGRVDTWRIVLIVVAFIIIRRCFSAILRPSPSRVQTAVKQCLMSLIILDAAVSLLAAGPAYGVTVVALLAPAVGLGMWVYST